MSKKNEREIGWKVWEKRKENRGLGLRGGLMEKRQIIAKMSLEEKAGMCSGADFWNTKEVERLGVPKVCVSDGPHGLRKVDETEVNPMEQVGTIKAVCFPTASALACSFNPELLRSMGESLGEECQAEDISTLLGPGINMKRSPLCGRNFEYFSEDPYLAGEMGAALVNGIQSKKVGTSLKHFAANSQETRRMTVSAKVDERTLREIYLTAFEKVVKQAQPWTIMCSYNAINGVYSCENDWLLNQVLRKEWGFQGLVMSDWGAMNQRVKALQAGLDLEMPGSNGVTDKELVAAVKNGELSEEVLDQACERVLSLVEKYIESHKVGASYDKEAHHKLSARVEEECAVLLKNEDLLPLQKEQRVAFIGGYAKQPRYQGGGSSHVNSFKVSSALESLENCEKVDPVNVSYSCGFETEQVETNEVLLREAVKAAAQSEVAVIFAGLPESFESEGGDRKHMDLPECQNRLIEEVVKVQPNTVVVLHNGAPVVLPWQSKVKAILEMYLGGQAVGEAAVNLLYGKVNPSGKLAESFPLRLEDNPSYLNFPGTKEEINYAEGLFIGYRYYDTKKMPVAFPFGHGLSYTTFEYTGLKLKVVEKDQAEVQVTIRNTGKMAGKETVQFYVAPIQSSVVRPAKELKAFRKVFLQPREEQTIKMTLSRRAFAYYSVEDQDWAVESGEYEVLCGSSSRDIRLKGELSLEGDQKKAFVVTDHTLCRDVVEYLGSVDRLAEMVYKFGQEHGADQTLEEVKGLLEGELPVHSVRSFSKIDLTNEDMQGMIESLTNSRN